MGVADPLAAVAVAADNDRNQIIIPGQPFCREDIAAGIVAGLLLAELFALDRAVVAADVVQQAAYVFVPVVLDGKGAHRHTHAHDSELVII